MVSCPTSIAVDAKGIAIAGSKRLPNSSERRANHTKLKDMLFLFHPDGRSRSGIDTTAEPRSLAATTDEQIVASFMDNSLQVTKYTGSNWRTIQSPPGVASWIPGPVCCSKQGEIYVINYGETFAVYKYLIDGDLYLGCAIKDLHNPTGIAISDDGKKLYITEGYLNLVKVFECPP